MKNYSVVITYEDPYPKTAQFVEKAGNHGTAINRAFKKWRLENKGKRAKRIKITSEIL